MRQRSVQAVTVSMLFALAAPLLAIAADEVKQAAEIEPTTTLLAVHVVDSDGEPAADAQAYLLFGPHGLSLTQRWHDADDAGALEIAADDLEFSLVSEQLAQGVTATLVVRAEGHAWSTQEVKLPSNEPVPVELNAGRPLTININTVDSKAIPDDLAPAIYAEGLSVPTWATIAQGRNKEHGEAAKFSAGIVKRTGPGQFRTFVPNDVENVWVLVHHPGFLRAYQSEPFSNETLASGTLNVTLPSPATLTIDMHPAEGGTHDYAACGATLMVVPEVPDGQFSFRIYSESSEAQRHSETLADLAPGNYSIVAGTYENGSRVERGSESFFQSNAWMELAAGETKEFIVALETFDEAAQRERLTGDYSLTLKLTKSDGSSVGRKPYTLEFVLQKFGRTMPFKEGELPESGEITIDGLPAGPDAMLQFAVDGNMIDWIFVDPEQKHATHTFTAAPAVGETAPDILLTRLDNDETFKLSSLRGQVVFLDFWASWCGPCQDPMAHNNDVMKRRTDWQGNAVIIGASIDNEIDTIKDHVSKHEWANVLQAHCNEGEKGWQCDAVKRYAVTGVPTCFLIDREGKIAWSGHPASIDVEEKIDELIGQ